MPITGVKEENRVIFLGGGVSKNPMISIIVKYNYCRFSVWTNISVKIKCLYNFNKYTYNDVPP